MRSSEITAAALFEFLGWDYAKDGRKCVPLSYTCKVLGVLFNLEEPAKGICKLFNTTSRIEEIAAEVERVVQAGHLLQSDAQKLRGRLQFAEAEAQLYCRTGKRCIRVLRDAACRKRSKLDAHHALALRLFVKLMQANPELSGGMNRRL